MDKFQAAFLDAILTESTLPEEFLKEIRPAGRLSPQDVIQVYRHDYELRLEEALGKNFEATWLLLGDDDFHTLAQEFIACHPSDLKNLTAYGETFPQFLESQNQEEYIVEMAMYEKNFWRIFHTAPKIHNALNPDDLGDREFSFEYVYLSHSSIGLHALWLLREGSDQNLSLKDFIGEEFLVIYRTEQKVEVKKLNEAQFKILSLIRETKSLPQTFERLEEMKVVTVQEDWPLIFSVLSYCY